MADATLSAGGSVRTPTPDTVLDLRGLEAARPCRPGPRGSGLSRSHPDLVVSPVLGPDDQLAIMSLLDEAGGICSIGDLAHALPSVERPIAAVLALVDAGLLGIDIQSPFDSTTQVWRH